MSTTLSNKPRFLAEGNRNHLVLTGEKELLGSTQNHQEGSEPDSENGWAKRC